MRRLWRFLRRLTQTFPERGYSGDHRVPFEPTAPYPPHREGWGLDWLDDDD